MSGGLAGFYPQALANTVCRHPELATPFTTGRARERTCFDRRGHHGGCACATEALRAAYAMWGEGQGDAASARAAATRHGVDRATPAREMRSSEGRVLETADAFLDDKADRLWRTRSAALRELAQKVRETARMLCSYAREGLSPVTAIC